MIDPNKMTQAQIRSWVNNGGRTDEEVAAANSPEKIAAALAEFARVTGHKDDPNDPFEGTEVARIAKSINLVVTPEAILEAWEIRQASRMPRQDLKRILQERG